MLHPALVRTIARAGVGLCVGLMTLCGQEKIVVRVPMRDGVKLSTNVFLPGVGRYPALLVRTPYNKGQDLLPGYRIFIARGFAVVVQDVRGRYESQGIFSPPSQEVNDGDDTLKWIARQRWSTGSIGMLGGSYLGIAQWKAVISGNKHLKAIFPGVSGHDDYFDRFYSRGGALKLGHRLLWMHDNVRAPGHRTSFGQFTRHVPLRSADVAATGQKIGFWQEALSHPTYDSYWKSRSTVTKMSRLQVPAFILTGWYDNFAQSDLELFALLRKQSPHHRIIVGPWAHSMSAPFPGVNFGPESQVPIRQIQAAWFARWLTPATQAASNLLPAAARIFVMGINRWRDEPEWPIARAVDTPFYLASSSSAKTLNGDGALVPLPRRRPGRDDFVYNPADPVPTRGGPVCCSPTVFPWGPMDQRAVENRSDVLVYTSSPLKNDLEVTGSIRAVLFVSTTAADTDFTVKLVDVFPDGTARNLTDGILRLRYRNSIEKPDLAKPSEVYRITVDAGVTSNVFLEGHSIRVEISSSNFPRFDRNPNTGKSIADERSFVTASQTVYHGRLQPSHVLLPIVSGSAATH